MDAPLRLVRSAARRWRRFSWRGRTNAPRLSGDLFRSMADVVFERDDVESRAAVAGGQVVFVKTDALPAFLAVAPSATECRVLITGNSDLEIHQAPPALPPRLARWFAQNTFITSSLIEPLPIGLENAALGQNGRPSLFRACPDEDLARKRLRAFAAFGATTPARKGVLEMLARSAMVDVERARMSPARFQRTLRGYRFVIAPRGNGVDTHRFWEALYADAIPVTTRSRWSTAIAALGVPIVEVDDWREVGSWAPAHLESLSDRWPDRVSTLPILWEPFWRDRLRELVST
jgi:hypothetical protein